jgi:hypothetical protein
MRLVFISHATVDHELIEQFVDIILKGCGLAEADIFASSIPGMDVHSGSDLLAAVRAEVSDTTLVIAMITPTYSTRPVCVAELGAAWGVAGKLLPVLAPGMKRDSLGGILTGIKVDYLDEDRALDEIAGRIEAETGLRPESHASWTRAKKKWLRVVGDLAAALPQPEVVSNEEHDELKAKLADSEQALADAEREVAELKIAIERLKAAKDAVDVAEILLPKGDIERFERLRQAAVDALQEVPLAVREAIRRDLSGEEMRPDPMQDRGSFTEAEEAVSEGLLINTDDGFVPNNDQGRVRRATRAVGALADALYDNRFEPEFYEWFENKYDGPPKLGQGVIWRSVFSEVSGWLLK